MNRIAFQLERKPDNLHVNAIIKWRHEQKMRWHDKEYLVASSSFDQTLKQSVYVAEKTLKKSKKWYYSCLVPRLIPVSHEWNTSHFPFYPSYRGKYAKCE